MLRFEVNEGDYPSKGQIWENFYQCRNFELSSFWQKSVFLFGFISLCFGGYGALLLKTAEKDVNLDYLNEYMFAISILGILLSYVWIAMCKGSKAWYEVYEKVIYGLEDDLFRKKGSGKYIEGDFIKDFKDEIDNHLLFNYKGGAFSPSKVNIFIGNILWWIWIICALICVANIIYNTCVLNCKSLHLFVFFCTFLFGIIIISIFPKWLNASIKSRILAKNVQNLSNHAQKVINDKLDEFLGKNDAKIDDCDKTIVMSSYEKYLTDEINKKIKKEASEYFEREFAKVFEDQVHKNISNLTKQQISEFVKLITKEK